MDNQLDFEDIAILQNGSWKFRYEISSVNLSKVKECIYVWQKEWKEFVDGLEKVGED